MVNPYNGTVRFRHHNGSLVEVAGLYVMQLQYLDMKMN